MGFAVLKHINKTGRYFSLALSAFAAVFIFGASSLTLAEAQAAGAQSVDMDAVKKSLLDDPLFLSHLRDKISADSMNGDAIHEYLLAHPEVLMEMQDALVAKSSGPVQGNAEQAKLIKDNAKLLYHSEGDIILGNKNAKLILLEFYDYNCGYCKREFPELQKLVAKNKNVKIIMKDYPILGDDSMQAHLIAHAVKKLNPSKYPAFHEKLMTLKGRATEASALAIAKSLGLNEDAVKEAMQTPDVQQDTLASARIAYRLGLNYTPVFISGTQIYGAVDIKSMPKVIDQLEKSGGNNL